MVPLVALLRDAVVARGGDAAAVHRGLTSQDVLDTALVLLARDALRAGARRPGRDRRPPRGPGPTHRDTVMAGRTLTQHAVPTTFGLKAAQWLAAVHDAADGVDAALGPLPVQYGGAAGTRALAGRPAPDADPAAVAAGLRGRASGCGPAAAVAHPPRRP